MLKTPRPHSILVELLKMMKDNAININSKFFDLYIRHQRNPQRIVKYDLYFPTEKLVAKFCENYRTINLITHLLKSFLGSEMHHGLEKHCSAYKY